jgi:hypothetical protein
MAQTATDFTANDCNGTSHNLFTELNAGKVIVLCWVMPCGACTGPALTTYNVVQSYQGSNPNKVYMYTCDDYANTNCTALNSWATGAGVAQQTWSLRFSNAVIDMANYGSAGMPKIVVIGPNHTVFYNVNNTVNSANLQNAINAALSTTGNIEHNNTASFLNILPNPAGSTAEIKFNLIKSSDIALELYNLEGKMVQQIFSGKLNAGENKIPVNLEKLTDGMYLVKFSDGGKNQFINLVKSN